MNPVTGVLLYLTIWFMCLFVILPLRLQSQGESGEVVPGTSPSAPVDPKLGKKAIWVTIAATAVFIPVFIVIINGWISIDDIDIFNLGSELR
ncbi:MAG: DUF1467 family protein [Rhodobacteraceae bacterium]|nr:DUF1467 family protein [Paracoccaceae bacterium]